MKVGGQALAFREGTKRMDVEGRVMFSGESLLSHAVQLTGLTSSEWEKGSLFLGKPDDFDRSTHTKHNRSMKVEISCSLVTNIPLGRTMTPKRSDSCIDVSQMRLRRSS